MSGGAPPGNYAMFVDYENIAIALGEKAREASSRVVVSELVVKVLARLKESMESPKVMLRFLLGRAYGDWTGMSDAPASLALMSIKPVYVLAKPGKNSADLELSLDAQETLLGRQDVDHFLIVGGDRDYIPIVGRIREQGKAVTVAAFAEAMSGDLKAIVGSGFIDLGQFVAPLIEPQVVEPVIELPVKERGGKPRKGGKPVPQIPIRSEAAVKEENLQKAIDLATQATVGRDPMEIPLVSFYKDYMNEAFVTLSNEQRKELVETMRQSGIVELEMRPGWSGAFESSGFDMVVMTVNADHPEVRKRLPVGRA